MARVGRRRRQGNAALAMALTTALLASVAPSFADTDDENARRHFESGAAYLQQSDNENALREFQAAYALSKRPPLLLNIANVYERMGKHKEAVDSLTKYLEEDPKVPDRTTIETRIANLKKRIEAAPPPPSVASAAPAPIAPPAVTASASAGPPQVPPPAAPPANGPNRAPAYLVLGIGGAAAIGAVVTGFVAKGKYDDADKQCKPNCSSDTVSSIQSMALVSDVLTGVAVAGVGVGAILLLTSGPSAREPISGVKPALAGSLGPSSARFQATWRF